MMTLLIVAGALAYLFWPKVQKAAADAAIVVPSVPPSPFPPSDAVVAPSPPPGPDARAAIDSLLAVRDRLAATDALDEDSAKAVDVLWLDLLHGSAKR